MKTNITLTIIVIIIIAIILLINFTRSDGDIDEETAKCIAENSKLYISKTCSHCAEQKSILGDYLEFFELIDCGEEPLRCQEEIGIPIKIPTWKIQDAQYSGVHSLDLLKQKTDC